MGSFLKSLLLMLLMMLLMVGPCFSLSYTPHDCLRDGDPANGAMAKIRFQDCMCRVYGGDHCLPSSPGAPPHGRTMNAILCKRLGGSFCVEADDSVLRSDRSTASLKAYPQHEVCSRDGEPAHGSQAEIDFQDCMCRVYGGDHCLPASPESCPRGRTMNGFLCKRFGGSYCADAEDVDATLRTHAADTRSTMSSS